MTCVGDCHSCLKLAAEQPHGPEWSTADGVFVKTMAIPRAGTIVPQHAHSYEHLTLLAHGSVEVRRTDEPDAIVMRAPATITIPAGIKHSFLSLEDSSVLYCVHSIHRSGSVEISEEHNLL